MKRNCGKQKSKHQLKTQCVWIWRENWKVKRKEKKKRPRKNRRNDDGKANESSDKMKEEKIILNYLCVALVYGACGIRGQHYVENPFASFLGS